MSWMHTKRFLWAGLVMGLGAVGVRADYITNATPTLIPDNNSLGIQQTLELSGFSGWVDTVSVKLQISGVGAGAYNGDLYVTLQHESGFAVLLNRVGRTGSDPFGYGDNGFDIIFSIAGSDIHGYQDASYSLGPSGELTGTWGVDGRNVDPLNVVGTDSRTATLGSFNGLDPNGTWTLFVADVSMNGTAQLDEWALDVSVVPEPSTLAFLALGAAALAVRRQRMRV